MKAYELLEQPGNWIQEDLAIDRDGNNVHPCATTACQWCALGAIDCCYPTRREIKEVKDKLKIKLRTKGFPWIDEWNDNTTYEDVISTLRELDI